MGVQIGDPDQEILRLDSIIRSGLSPRIRHSTKAIRLASGKYVLIIRAEKSWYGPHRIIFKDDGRFYGRTSNGKYPLDVADLRNAFVFGNTVTEKLSSFRAERIIAISNSDALVTLAAGPKLVIHCMAIDSFGDNRKVPVLGLNDIKPIYNVAISGLRTSANFEGRIGFDTRTPANAYTQVFRNGVIEAVRVGILDSRHLPGTIPSLSYERAIFEYIPYCFQILKTLNVSPPLFIGISLVGVRGQKMALDAMLMSENRSNPAGCPYAARNQCRGLFLSHRTSIEAIA